MSEYQSLMREIIPNKFYSNDWKYSVLFDRRINHCYRIYGGNEIIAPIYIAMYKHLFLKIIWYASGYYYFLIIDYSITQQEGTYMML